VSIPAWSQASTQDAGSGPWRVTPACGAPLAPGTSRLTWQQSIARQRSCRVGRGGRGRGSRGGSSTGAPPAPGAGASADEFAPSSTPAGPGRPAWATRCECATGTPEHGCGRSVSCPRGTLQSKPSDSAQADGHSGSDRGLDTVPGPTKPSLRCTQGAPPAPLPAQECPLLQCALLRRGGVGVGMARVQAPGARPSHGALASHQNLRIHWEGSLLPGVLSCSKQREFCGQEGNSAERECLGRALLQCEVPGDSRKDPAPWERILLWGITEEVRIPAEMEEGSARTPARVR